MVIKNTPKGNIVITDKPIVAFKDTTYKLIELNVIFYGVEPELGREIVKFAISAKSLQDLFVWLDKNSPLYDFEYTFGFGKRSSIKRFESEFMMF